MKRIISSLIIIIITLFTISCNFEESGIYLETNLSTMDLNSQYKLNDYIDNEKVFYVSSDSDIILIEDYVVSTVNPGICYIYAYSSKTGDLLRKSIIEVEKISPTKMQIECSSKILNVNDIAYINIKVEPEGASQDFFIECNDKNVLDISNDGQIKALSTGVATVTITSIENPELIEEIIFVVKNDGVIINTETKEENIKEEVDVSSMQQLFSPIIDTVKESVIGLKSYVLQLETYVEKNNATGIIYKEEIINDNYKYYVMVNKHIVDKMDKLVVYYDEYQYAAQLIASDSKVDLAILSFMSEQKYQVAKLGNSDSLRTGQFILAIGNAYNEGFHSTSFGVISYTERYLTTDTDGDGVNDWDSLYIQHDAAISEGMSGGAIVDLNGNIIAINTTKIVDDYVDNMGFAIPINYALELAEQLEKGIVPERPLLGVTGIYIKEILSSEYYMNLYNIPKEINYGIYISETIPGGVADSGGIQKGDILLKFDGEEIRYSHNLRAKLGECVIGSNEEIEIEVYRNGKVLTLKVVF